MPSPSQVTGGHSGCHRPRGFPVSVGMTGHQCESAHRGGEPAPPEPQRMADRAGEARTGGDFSRVPPAPEAPPPKKRSGPSQGTPEGRKHPFPPHPPRQWEDPPERPRGEDPPSKGREEPPGQASSPGTDDGGIRQRSHAIPRGGKPHLFMDAGHPGKTEAQTGVDAEASAGGLQSRPSSCCTLGRMMRGPWMPTSMRPSRSTFGRWISGERAETWARTCWARSLT